MTGRSERDEWLMGQVALGHREALEPLVRRYAGPLSGFIRRLVGDPHKSEDLFQDVFLAVWAKRVQYQFPRPFKPWLYAIALNACRAAFRSAPRRTFAELDSDPAEVGPAPGDALLATETAGFVAQAVQGLPEQQRLAVVMRVWEGMSYAEIAQIVGRSEATVRSNMHHALAALRGVLEPMLD